MLKKYVFHIDGDNVAVETDDSISVKELIEILLERIDCYEPLGIDSVRIFEGYSEKKVVGIDRGIRFLAAAYDGKKTSFYSGAAVKQKRAHYKELRRQLQQRQTSSARRRIRAIGQKENRWMNDVNHRISKALVCSNPKGTLFVLEDLTGIRGATERVRVRNRYTQVSWAYYDLEQKLMYKAIRYGSALLTVDPDAGACIRGCHTCSGE